MTERPQSPVDVIDRIREDLAKFRRISNKRELGMTVREALREALLRAAKENVLASIERQTDLHPVVEHFVRSKCAIEPDPADAA
jgi:hypothetical protein